MPLAMLQVELEDQLRFYSSNFAGADHATHYAVVDGDCALLVHAPTGKRAKVDAVQERLASLADSVCHCSLFNGAAVRSDCGFCAAVVAVVAASLAGVGAVESATCFAAVRRTFVLARTARLCSPAHADTV